jgi:hypothetical protein
MRRAILTVSLAVICFAGSQPAARAGCQYNASQIEQMKQFIAYYQQNLKQICADSRLQSQCTQIKNLIATYTQAIQQCQSQTTPPPSSSPSNPCDQVKRIIEKQAADSKQNALNIVSRLKPGSHGGYNLTYYYPPTYCSNPQYTPAARPYFVSKADATRVITQLTNNGCYISNVVAY